MALILLLVVIPIPIQGDYLVNEIAIFEGNITYEVGGNNATIIPVQNFEYIPGWLIYIEYSFTTNTSSYFTDINYANTMSFRSQMGTVINYLDRVELTNNSYHNDLIELTLYGNDKIPVYLSTEIIPDSGKGSLIDLKYKIVIFENDDRVIVETMSHSGEITFFPSTLEFTSSYVGTHKDDIYMIMPKFSAENESRLPEDYHYVMDINFRFEVIGVEDKTEFIFSIPPYSDEAKIEVEKDGIYELTLRNMDNREFQRLNIHHDGSDLQLIIQSISIDIPELIDVPEELITPLSIKISGSITAIIIFFLPYKFVDSYGKRQIKNKMEDLY